jgi:hypothetical protein
MTKKEKQLAIKNIDKLVKSKNITKKELTTLIELRDVINNNTNSKKNLQNIVLKAFAYFIIGIEHKNEILEFIRDKLLK